MITCTFFSSIIILLLSNRRKPYPHLFISSLQLLLIMFLIRRHQIDVLLLFSPISLARTFLLPYFEPNAHFCRQYNFCFKWCDSGTKRSLFEIIPHHKNSQINQTICLVSNVFLLQRKSFQ